MRILTIEKDKTSIFLLLIIIIFAYFISQSLLSKNYIVTIFYLGVIPFILISLVKFEFSLLSMFFFAVFYNPLKDFSTSLLVFMGIDLYFLFVLLVWYGKKILFGEQLFEKSPLGNTFILFYVFVLVMGIVNPEASLMQTLGGLRAWLQFTPLYFLGYEMCKDDKLINKVINLFIILGILTSAYGIVQYILGPSYFLNASEISAQRHFNIYYATSGGELKFRVYSTFVQAGAFGGFLSFFLIIIINNILHFYKSYMYLLLNIFAVIIMLVALVLTGSRASWITFSVFFILLTLLKGMNMRIIPLIFFLILGGYAGVYLTGGGAIERAMTLQREGEVEVRYKGTFEYALDIVKEYPLGKGLGYGGGIPSTLSKEFNINTSYTDNEFGRALVDMGWVGFFGFSLFVLSLIKALLMDFIKLKTSLYRNIGGGILVALGTLFFTLPVGNSFICNIPQSLYLWFFIGVMDRLPHLDYELRKRLSSDLNK